ncbi:unnamed protein product [Cuscuta campestris]|uniref:GrpE protein homolog n=1 Tax=Cuscuta campestris TaxID=132261 RepID=A0A484KXN3_9ASTE|nr:unnamed protein product [Cuscuta campestris]
MAAGLSTSWYPLHPSSSSSSGASKSLQIQAHYGHFHLYRPIRATISPLAGDYNRNQIIFRNSRRSSPRASLTAQDSAPQCPKLHRKLEAREINGNEADENYATSLTSLVQVYKVAILNGDVKAVTEIEAMMCQVEKEKTMLAERISALSDEIGSGKAKYIRLQADFDNFRKRYDKEKSAIRGDTQAEIIGNLLPIVDNFERAKQQIKLETEREKNIGTSYQGIYKQFVEIMKSLQVTMVPTVGKPFDPTVHEAIAREESREFQESREFREGIITQELRRGFKLGSRLLRPAMVKVSSGSRKGKQWGVAKKSVGQFAATLGVDD